jgi:acetoacetyl-CoA synthetase
MVDQARMTRFMRERGFDGYDELWHWSVDDLEGFWAALWDHFDVGPRSGPVLASRAMPGARWFPEVELNYAEYALRDRDPDATAILHMSESRELAELSWGELRTQVARIAAGLKALGVGRGDRVVAYLPNIPETVAAFLATASLGAVWSSAAPEFGARSVIDRFAQIEPKVLLAIDG